MTTHPQPFNTLKRPEKGSKAIRKYCEEVDKIFNLIKGGQLSFLSKFSSQELCQLRITNYKRNILHIAVWYFQQNLIEAICSNQGFRGLINDCDINGETPLHLAVFCQNFDAFKRLTEAGASLTSVNKQNEQPLDVVNNAVEWQGFLYKVRELFPDPKLVRITSQPEDKFNMKNNQNSTSYNTLTPTQLDIQTKKNVVAETRDRTTEDKGHTSRNETELSRFGYRNEWETFLDATNQNESQAQPTTQRNMYKVNIESVPEKNKEILSDYAVSPMIEDKNKLKTQNDQDRFSIGRSSAPVQQNELKVSISRPQNKASTLIKTYYQNREVTQDPSFLNAPAQSSARDASFLSQDSQSALYRGDD